MKYQSEIIKEIIDTRGHEKSSLHYESECIETWIEENKGAYPKLTDYQGEWLNYISILEDTGGEDPEPPIGEFPYETITDVTEATFENVVPFAYQSAILKGSTKYRDIDTGDVLDTFDETKNLELVSVKMPVLTTSNGDGTKTNILTVNEPVELRGIGDVKDELDLLTGELTQRIGEIVLNGSENGWVYGGRGSTTAICYIENYFTTPPTNAITNYFSLMENRPDVFWNGVQDRESFCLNDKSLAFRIEKTKLKTLDYKGIKEWLSQNNLIIQYGLAAPIIKTVDLSIQDQNGKTLSVIKPIEGTMHLSTSSDTIKPLFSGEIPVEAITQNLASFIDLEMEE